MVMPIKFQMDFDNNRRVNFVDRNNFPVITTLQFNNKLQKHPHLLQKHLNFFKKFLN